MNAQAAAPSSAARLAAEAAFAAPGPDAGFLPPAQVTVRRSRLARDSAAAEAGGAAHAHGDAAKGPRTFRLAAAVDGPTAPAEPAPAGHEPARQRLRSARRIAADKRPSPVVQVFQAPRPDPVAAPAGDPRLRRIGEHLAPLDRLLGEIARAQSFQIDVGGFAPDWQALGRRVEQLRAELHQLLRGPVQ